MHVRRARCEVGKNVQRVTVMEEFFEKNCCYDVYKEVWDAAVGELLVCKKVPENSSD